MKVSLLVTTLFLAAALLPSGCGGLSDAEKHLNAGVNLQVEGRLEEAIAEYDEAIRLDPLLAQAYTNRGLAYDDLGQHQPAIQDFDEAIRLDPQLALAYASRAIAYTHMGDDTKVQQDVDRALELGTDDVYLKSEIERLKELR